MKETALKEKYEEIIAKIEAYQTIIIHRHMRPDPDALGSQGGLAALIKGSYPEKKVLQAGGNLANLSFLGEMDHIADEVYEEALVIVTDTANRPRIDDARYTKGAFLIKIDHHPEEDKFGDLSLVDTRSSSCSEIIAHMALLVPEKLPLNQEAARLLYAGIVGDTGRFLYSATTSRTHMITAALLEFPFSASDMAQKMNTVSLKTARLSGYVFQNLAISAHGVASIVLSQEVLQQFQAHDSDTAQLVPLPGTIEDVYVWGVFVEQLNGTFRCRLRSKGPVINTIAQLHGGGGHPLASGANAKDETEIRQILGEFETCVEEWLQK